jgi:hypothetical protein
MAGQMMIIAMTSMSKSMYGTEAQMISSIYEPYSL